MESNFQTSFIPKKPIVEERVIRTRSVGFLTIISFFILFAVLLITGGLYFFKVNLTKNITQMGIDLNLAKNRFEPSKITELKVFDKRLRASSEILSKHIAITPIFAALSAITMKTVRYTQFGYGIGADGKVSVKMTGLAVGYRSIALQSDLFSTRDEGKNFIDPIFSNLTLDDKGNVMFSLEFSVDPTFVDYKTTLAIEESPT
ncbi:hypothetical protein EXS45_00805 [Candidatus Nomurabacteria bacterium]|nr:hypothetical protein [Candidatus Nomurabacteria bacterium]